jgi:hypothetical protein
MRSTHSYANGDGFPGRVTCGYVHAVQSGFFFPVMGWKSAKNSHFGTVPDPRPRARAHLSVRRGAIPVYLGVVYD